MLTPLIFGKQRRSGFHDYNMVPDRFLSDLRGLELTKSFRTWANDSTRGMLQTRAESSPKSLDLIVMSILPQRIRSKVNPTVHHDSNVHICREMRLGLRTEKLAIVREGLQESSGQLWQMKARRREARAVLKRVECRDTRQRVSCRICSRQSNLDKLQTHRCIILPILRYC